MKKVGIAIDHYKLKAFKKGLDDAGYKYTVHGGQDDPLLCIKVDCPDDEVMSKLHPLVSKMDKQASN